MGLDLFKDRVADELMCSLAPARELGAVQLPSQIQVVPLRGRCTFPHSLTAPPS